MTAAKTVSRPRPAGFSLVELMVGMAIGLLTVLVVVNVLTMADARRKVTTGGADATTASQLAMYSIERAGKNAGYGVTTIRDVVGCPIHVSHLGVQKPIRTLAPAQIVDGAGTAPDALRFMLNFSDEVALPARIVLDHAKEDTSFFLRSRIGFKTGDLMLAVPADIAAAGVWCTVLQVTGIDIVARQVKHEGGDWNMAAVASIMPAGGYKTGEYLIKLGDHVEQEYAVRDGNLQLTTYDIAGAIRGAAGRSLYAGVVQLQAVYGKDTSAPADGVVDTWDTVAPTGAGWQQVMALRVALVTRSPQRDAEPVTEDGATTCAVARPPVAAVCWKPDPAGTGEQIDVSAGMSGDEWRHYRYQVLETTIPLRNAIWQQ